MDKSVISKIEEYLKSNRDAIIDTLFSLVRIPSVESKSEGEGMPYGKECRKALDLSTKIFASHGFNATVHDGYFATASLDGKSGKKTIGIFSHADVVPPGDDWRLAKPFEPAIVGDYLVGRGIEDNKAGIVISLYAPLLLKNAGIELQSNYLSYIGSAEETGMSDIAHFTKAFPMPDACLVPDSGFPVCRGEKSICRFDAKSNRAFCDIISLEGGKAYNIVLDKLTARLKYSPELYEYCRAISREGEISAETDGKEICVNTFGVACHASTPEGAVNAAAVFSKAFLACPYICEGDRELLCDMALLTGSFYAEGTPMEYSDDSGRLTFVNGMCRLTDDGVPVVSIDIRHGCSLSGEKLCQAIDDFLSKMGWSAKYCKENDSGYEHDSNGKIIKLFENTYNAFEKEHGATMSKSFYMGGGTYSRKLKNAYSIGTEAGYLPSEPLPLAEGHGGAHQCDECISIDGFLEAIKLVALMIWELDKLINSDDN